MPDLGTQGGAIIISLFALATSILFPLYLERRRERREASTGIVESWRKIVEVSEPRRLGSVIKPGPEGLAVIRRWIDGVRPEIEVPGGCLWGSQEAVRSYEELVERLRIAENAFSAAADVQSVDAMLSWTLLLDQFAATNARVIHLASRRVRSVAED